VFLSVQTLIPLFFLTVPNFVVFFKLLDGKFNEGFKNVLKTIILSHQVGFTGNSLTECSFKVCLILQTLTPLFSLTVPNFVVFFKLLDGKFNEDFKNVLKKVIFAHQVGL